MLQLYFEGKTYSLIPPTFCIGRHANNQIVIADSSLPEFLVSLVQCDCDWRLVPLDSSEKVYLDGLPVLEPSVLQPGHEIRFGVHCIYVGDVEQGLHGPVAGATGEARTSGFAVLSQFKLPGEGLADETERLFNLPEMGVFALSQLVPSLSADRLGSAVTLIMEDDELWMSAAEPILVNGISSSSCRLYSDDEIQCTEHILRIHGPQDQVRVGSSDVDIPTVSAARPEARSDNQQRPEATELDDFRNRLSAWLYQNPMGSVKGVDAQRSEQAPARAPDFGATADPEKSAQRFQSGSADPTPLRGAWVHACGKEGSMRGEPNTRAAAACDNQFGMITSASALAESPSQHSKLNPIGESNTMACESSEHQPLFLNKGAARFCTGRMGRVLLLIGLFSVAAYVLG